MRVFARVAAPLLLTLIACKVPSRLEGKWRGIRADGVPAEAQPVANAFAASMRIDVRGNRITVTTAKETQSGVFRIVKDTRGSVVIETERGESNETFLLVDDKTLRWEVSPSRGIVFARE